MPNQYDREPNRLGRELDHCLAADAIPSSSPQDPPLDQPSETRKSFRVSMLDQHPMRTPIIAAMLAGESFPSIAKWTFPKVGVWVLRRYYHVRIAPALQRARHTEQSLSGYPRDPSDAALAKVAQTSLADTPVLSVRKHRLDRIQDRANRLDLIVHERAEEMADEVAGGASGLITRDLRSGGTVYKVDKTLLSELREHEKEMARELGQLQERPTVAIQIVMPGPDTGGLRGAGLPAVEIGAKV
jgi:hypothetical protein